MRFKDLAGTESPTADADADKIMFIGLAIGSGSVLMGNDVPTFMGNVSENENRSKISVRTDSKEEADTIFNGLSVGGEVEAPIGESPWGTYFGSFRDKYGIEWMVEFVAA